MIQVKTLSVIVLGDFAVLIIAIASSYSGGFFEIGNLVQYKFRDVDEAIIELFATQKQ